ncbi:MAG: glycosyltransferase family 2 protein [Oscillospiraceae bacterium]|jgi:glycosyltransferase involved in cell wall biosynthesis|nr:glycosyltransferase family 2 protein [Oscillospiraceae bacterium]
MKKILYIIIPCYNEEDALPQTARVILAKLRALTDAETVSPESRIVLIDDGSRDRTWALIEGLSDAHPEFCGIKLSRNRGTQNAIMAGLDLARRDADVTITTDADLQDDIDAIDRMLTQYFDGAEIVYGVRARRDKDTFLKRFTAESYYKFLNTLGCDTVFNHSDYRLLSRRALTALAEYGERDLFLRGIAPMLGYKTAVVTYDRAERSAGETKYNFWKLLALAINGATSLSLRPLRFIVGAGIFMLFIAFVLLVGSVVGLLRGADGLAYLLLHTSVWGVGGVITLSLGIAGEYAGRAYMEAKHRPRYHIESLKNIEPEETR